MKSKGNPPTHTPRQRQRYLRHPREVLPLSREVARAEADVVCRVLGLNALHVFDLPLTTKGKRLVPVSRRMIAAPQCLGQGGGHCGIVYRASRAARATAA